MRPYILFDFDGTIADSLTLGLELINRLAPIYHIHPITDEDIQAVRSMPTGKAIRYLKIPYYKLPILIPVFLNEYKHIIHNMKPFPRIHEVIQDLKDLGIPMALLTSNSKENVHVFLDQHDMNYFEWIEGGSGIFKKQVTIMHQIKKHNLQKENIIYVGDETRDIVAAKKCGIKIISVAWGFQDKSILSQYNPDMIAETPQDLYDIIKSYSTT
ncbi:MAG: carotenoid oxygenase [Candidatus Cloacimonetes bacterium HGW-Cloacimonetes-1]|jgi:HAD superfamily hydrolase (TIGR01549 family)|nr:MAG: carotenoid oxygenase [Candidatus Cloacimonetes bacterium HGW-Cloacimonetes-1]